MITRKTSVALAMLLLAGFAGPPGTDAAECPKLIGPDWSGETLSPDPARLLSISDVYHARMVYEPFVAADSDMQPIPWLAESWKANDKATEWTFKVRPGRHVPRWLAADRRGRGLHLPPAARSGDEVSRGKRAWSDQA